MKHEIEEKLADRIVNRINETNTFILQQIGENIKKISTIIPSHAYQLEQMLKYGGSYEEIARKLAKISGQNIQDIYKMFEEIAKGDKQFAKQFYKYRGIDFIPYSKDIVLQNQVNAFAEITAMQYINFSNTTTIGYLFEDLNGNKMFKNIQQTYHETIDRAILSMAQGKESFHTVMRNTLKRLGRSGLVVYDSGVTRRLDSAVRMNILGGLRDLNNTLSMNFGQEYGSDGVEITVHENSAPDHADAQGRQFSLEEYRKLQEEGIAKDITGRTISLYNGNNFRPISEYNCYHEFLNIVIGVSKPQYTEEQLKKIKEDNEKGFEYEGKHYTNYEGTQLQRKIETEIRRQRDTKTLAKASGDDELKNECQDKIDLLTSKYKDLCNISGLRPRI